MNFNPTQRKSLIRSAFSFRFFPIIFPVFFLNGCTGPDYPKSDHFNGKKFFNPGVEDEARGFVDLIKWRLGSGRQDWPDHLESKAKPNLTPVAKDEVHVTFINHATHLVQFANFNVITDPVFVERASPVQWAGPKRYCDSALKLEQLPKLDVVVVSHNHYDHMDLASLKWLSDNQHPVIIVPLGNKKYLDDDGILNVVELDWWQSWAPGNSGSGEGTKITLVPAQHWSRRRLADRNEALWGGYIFESGTKQVYFAGDTGYGPHFAQIHAKFPNLFLGIIPIGAYEPRWFMKPQHMNPPDAVQAAEDLGAKNYLGTHYGCFRLTDEAPQAPVEDLKKSLEAKRAAGVPLKFETFEAPPTGTTSVFR